MPEAGGTGGCPGQGVIDLTADSHDAVVCAGKATGGTGASSAGEGAPSAGKCSEPAKKHTPRAPPKCVRCRNHGVEVLRKGHAECPHKLCECRKCAGSKVVKVVAAAEEENEEEEDEEKEDAETVVKVAAAVSKSSASTSPSSWSDSDSDMGEAVP